MMVFLFLNNVTYHIGEDFAKSRFLLKTEEVHCIIHKLSQNFE